MLVKTVTWALLCTLACLACARPAKEEKARSVTAAHTAEQAAACDTSRYGSIQYLAALPAVKQASGRDDLAADPATRVESALLSTPTGQRIVSTISWGGLGGGSFLLMNCGGQVLDSAELGYVWSLHSQDVTGDGVPDVIVEQRTGTGTGLEQRETTIYGVAGDSIAALWSAVTFEGSYQGAELGGAWEIHAKVRFPGVGRIEVEKDSVAVRYDPGAKAWKASGTAKETSEGFVFDRKLGMFVPERAA